MTNKLLIAMLSLLFLSSCADEPSSPAEEQLVEDNQIGRSDVTLPGEEATRQGVTFAFPQQFGRSFAFTAELIEKQNTYYDQNLLKTPFVLKVRSVEGVALQTPVTIEPDLPEGFSETYQVGDTVQWVGYERLKEVGWPSIEGEDAQQIDLHYVNQLVILPERSDASPEDGR